MLDAWDHPDTARYYEAFSRAHVRYREANLALCAAADLGLGQRVLDVAAGLGGTAEVARATGCEVVCFEPARAMRESGKRAVTEAQWTGAWPEAAGAFDRVLCGAAIWQMIPLEKTFARVSALLHVGGVFAFNVPSMYLGEVDPPGGGRDPMLLELPALVAAGRAPRAQAVAAPPDAARIDELLREAGFEARRWCMRLRLTQAALRDWMKIPVISEALLGGIQADERAARIDAAYAECDAASWRWETWTGWTAWKL